MPNADRPAIAVVLPNYNGQKLLAKYLPSLVQAMAAHDTLLIIDDASSDESVQWLKSSWLLQSSTERTRDVLPSDTVAEYLVSQRDPRVRLIVNPHNLRFGASVNRAVRWADAPYVFVVNTDVKVSEDIFAHLIPHFADPLMFAVGCHEREYHQQGASAGRNKLWFERGMFRHSKADEFVTGETAWASGGSALFDRAKWLALGGFDPIYFPAYWEDIDLSWRARQKGWRVWFEASAIVEHRHETTNTDVFGQRRIAKMSWRNARIFTWRHASLRQKWEFVVWTPYYMWHQWRAGQL